MIRWLSMAAAVWFGWSGAACSSGSTRCDGDGDCPAGSYCRQDECVHDCTLDAECPEGFFCTARGRCERGCSKTNGGIEACDGIDNNCDGDTDEGLLNRCGECEPPDDRLLELCADGIDNDCDGETDEGFPRLGTPCTIQTCVGEWVCSPDRAQEICDAIRDPSPDDTHCDGVDEDCDGETDEDAGPVACELQQGVCAGAVMVCLDTGEWGPCDYGVDYTAGVDDTCDALDNDCDGETDEDAEPLLVSEQGPMASDGIDNNCNGLVDESGGVMLELPHAANVWIDVFETAVFEDPACTGTRYGETDDDYPAGWPAEGAPSVTLYACSLPGVVPSRYLSWYRSRRACEASGKRLCTAYEWNDACTGPGRAFPYAASYQPGVCNDAWQDDGAGGGELAETGAYPGCVSEMGVYDLSGNINEWVQEWDQVFPETAWTAGWSYFCEVCYYGTGCRACMAGDENEFERIENASDCRVTGRDNESFPRGDARVHFGGRCCRDGN